MKKKIILIIAIIVIAIIAVFAFMISKDLGEENKLTEEVNSLSSMLEADTLDYASIEEKLGTTVTTGDYATVETSAKKYLSDIVKSLKKIDDITSDEKIGKLLEISNLKKDGPSFKETKKYLKDYTTKLDKIYDEVASYFEEEKALSYLNTENLDSYYIDLYKKVTLGTDAEELKETKDTILGSIDTLRTVVKKEEKIIDFLIKNKTQWVIQDDAVAFYSQKQIDEYNKLIDDLNSYTSKVGA